MTDRQAHLAAILAAPDDDAPRLVFADWLDEHGEPERAEFIRVQCEIDPLQLAANAKQPYDNHAFTGLFGREMILLPKLNGALPIPHGRFVGTGTLTDGDEPAVKWRRGFIDAVCFTADRWLAHADAILAEHPVAEVRLTSLPGFFWQTQIVGEWVDSDEPWEIDGDPIGDGATVMRLNRRWPSVKKWHLPSRT